MSLLEYNVCETVDRRIISLQLVHANPNGDIQSKVFLPRAGPRLSNCNSYRLDYRGGIRAIRVFREGERISGLGFAHDRPDVPVTKIGYAVEDH